MAFNDYEVSSSEGRPVALYEFRYGNTIWRYSTSDSSLNLDNTLDLDSPLIYRPQAITDGGVTQGGSDQNDLSITTQSNLPIALLFQNRQPSGKVWLNVRRYHLGDASDETPLLWAGTVVGSSRIDEASVQLNCRSLGGTYDRQGLRLAWSRMCPHVLYSEFGCRVRKEDHAYPRVIATVTGTNFTCAAHEEPEEGSFTGGFLEISRQDGSFDRRAIEIANGNDFLVLGSTDGLEPGVAVTLYPGCVRDTPNCKAFGNLPNYGGFPHLPGTSPFDGTPVF